MKYEKIPSSILLPKYLISKVYYMLRFRICWKLYVVTLHIHFIRNHEMVVEDIICYIPKYTALGSKGNFWGIFLMMVLI